MTVDDLIKELGMPAKRKRIVRRCAVENVIPIKGKCRVCGATAKDTCKGEAR